MSLTQVLKTEVEVTDLTLPIFNPDDEWKTPSTLMLYDFRRIKCYPSQLATPPNLTPIVNLVTGSPSGTLNVATSGFAFAAGVLKLTGVNNNYINYGAGYDLPAMGSPDFLITLWIRIHADRSTINTQSLIHKGATTATAAGYTFAATYDGALNAIRFTLSNGTTTLSSAAVPYTEIDVWTKFGFAFETGKLKIFKNGELGGESATTITKPYNTHANNMKSFGQDAWNQFKGDVARIGFTKLDEGKTAAQRVADDWNANRVSIQALV